MKVCVVGAGAIGGLLGVRLANSGHDVSLIARGPHLSAIQSQGIKLVQDGEEIVANNVVATSDITELDIQDVVILALKAHQISPIVDQLPGLFGKDSVMVTLQNGIPWWYFQKLPGEYADGQLGLHGHRVPGLDAQGVVRPRAPDQRSLARSARGRTRAPGNLETGPF